MARKITPPVAFNRAGFPLQTCTRCGGCGEYSFNQITGTTCFGCNGTGLQIHRAAKAVYAEYLAARKLQVHPTASRLVAGDAILTEYAERPSRVDPLSWVTVEAVAFVPAKYAGWGGSGHSTRDLAQLALDAIEDRAGQHKRIEERDGLFWAQTSVDDVVMTVRRTDGTTRRIQRAGNVMVNRSIRGFSARPFLDQLPEALRRPAPAAPGEPTVTTSAPQYAGDALFAI